MLQGCKRPRIIVLYMFTWSLLLLTSPQVFFKALEKIHHHHHPPCQNKQTNPRGIDLFQKLEKGSKQEPDILFAPQTGSNVASWFFSLVSRLQGPQADLHSFQFSTVSGMQRILVIRSHLTKPRDKLHWQKLLAMSN